MKTTPTYPKSWWTIENPYTRKVGEQFHLAYQEGEPSLRVHVLDIGFYPISAYLEVYSARDLLELIRNAETASMLTRKYDPCLPGDRRMIAHVNQVRASLDALKATLESEVVPV